MAIRIPLRLIPRQFALQLWFVTCVVLAATAAAKDPEKREYRLTAPPLEIYDRLSELQLGEVPRLPDEERALLARIWELHAKPGDAPAETAAKIDQELLLEAMLSASGVEEPAARKEHRGRFHKLVKEARDAVKDAKDARERGEKLMQFLHAGVMQKGYEEEQTTFAAVFDTGEYNCVSSSAMYFLAGTHLGLELQPVAIPGNQFVAGHASLDLVDGGERLQVEPTNPDGFDWQAKVNRPGVIVTGLVPDRKKGHDVDGWGLAAMIYSNRGTALSKQEPPERFAAARCYLAALACDPPDESATNNLLAIFTNWGLELAEGKQFEESLMVIAFGLAIAPGHDSLQRNHVFAWSEYIDSALEGGDDVRAIGLVGRAREATRHRDFEQTGDWFIRLGQKQNEDWEQALAAAERGLKALPAAEHKPVVRWRAGLFRRWSQSLLESKAGPDVAGSMQVLARGYALDPGDEMMAGITYHTQEALALLETKSGVKAMSEHFAELRTQFPKVDGIAKAGRAHALNAITKLADEMKFDAAVAAVDAYQPLYAKPEVRDELGGVVYDRWAKHLADQKQWRPAVEKCAEGLRAFPKQDATVKRLRVTVDDWAQPAIDAKKWDEAIRIYDVGLEYAKGDEHLLRNRKFCEGRKGN
jgi:tetratricopeptide (TPR) repeat protein